MKLLRRYILTLIFTLWASVASAIPISIGFEYEVFGDGSFTSVTLPPFGSVSQVGPYELQLFDNVLNDFTMESLLNPSETFDFGPMGIDLFRIVGINESLMLDPNDIFAFPLGVALAGATQFTEISVTPITKDVSSVPAPVMFALYGVGIAFCAWSRLKKVKRLKFSTA